MPIRMSEAQARRAHKLAKKECCNCLGGFCVVFDSPCPQGITRSLVCKWFIRSVLPEDVPLYVELTGNRDKSKPCAVCGELFLPRSNRSKYCNACAAAVRAQKQRDYVRKMRADG